MTAERLYLIDGTALAYRSHFAFATSARGGLTTKAGKSTSAIFGFTITLRSLLEREKPDLIAISFDGPREDLERTRVYPEYKSTREKAPDELIEQLDDIRRVAEAFGIRVLKSPGHEADDVIGRSQSRAATPGVRCSSSPATRTSCSWSTTRIRMWNLRSSTSAPEILDAEGVSS